MHISNVAASLKYGLLLSNKQKALFYILLVCGLILTALSPVFLFEPESGSNKILVFCIMLIFSLGFVALGLFFLVRCSLLKKKILLWMTDAVEGYATAKKVDTAPSLAFIPAAIKIEVKFRINKKKYTRISGDGRENKGFEKIYRRYLDQDFSILYSPKYDEVMILKLQKSKRGNHAED